MKNIESKLIESRKYKPNAEFSKNSNLNPSLLKKLNSLYKDNSDQFWSSLAKQEIQWIKEFKSTCTGNSPFYKWFEEGKLNISENCLDRHRNKNKKAIIHITENDQKKIIRSTLKNNCKNRKC